MLVVFPSGSHYCFNGNCGDYYWGVNEHDAIWHISVANASFKSFPPLSPIFAGSLLSGYNLIIDLILHLFSIVKISPFIMYFKILPVIWFVGFSYMAIILAKRISKEKIFTLVFLFLSYFGASITFLIPLIREKTIIGNVSLSVTQQILTLTNIQLAFSYILLFWTLFILLGKKLSIKHFILLGLIVGLQWGLKFYTGFIATNIVCITLIIRWLKNKNLNNIFSIIFIGLCSIAAIILTYNPLGSIKQGSIFVFNPLALVWPLVEERSLLYSSYLANAKYYLLSLNRFSPRLIVLELVLIAIYIVLNFGPRILGLFYLLKTSLRKQAKDVDIAVLLSVVVSISMALLFVQRGSWWNVVQFLFPVFILLNLYTASFISSIKNNNLKVALFVLIIIFSLPYTYDALKDYAKYPGEIYINDVELSALSYLKKVPNGVVYVPLYRKSLELNIGELTPMSYHVDSSYISAYTDKQLLYSSQGQLELLNVDYQDRKKRIEQGDCSLVSKIDYAYFHKSQTDLFIKKCIEGNVKFKAEYTVSDFFIYSKIN